MKKYLFIVLLVGVCFGNDKLEKAKLLHDAALYKESKLLLTSLISDSNDDNVIGKSLFELGKVLISQNDFKNARKIFKRLLKQDKSYLSKVISIYSEYNYKDTSSVFVGYNVHPNPKQGSFNANAYKIDYGDNIIEFGLRIEKINYTVEGIYRDSDIIYISENELFDLYAKIKDMMIKQSGDFKLGANQSFRDYQYPSGLSIFLRSTKKPPWSTVSISKNKQYLNARNMGELAQVIKKAVDKVKELKSN